MGVLWRTITNCCNRKDVENDIGELNNGSSGRYNSGINYGQQGIEVDYYDLSKFDKIYLLGLEDTSLLKKIFTKRNLFQCNQCDYCIVVKRSEKPVSYVFLKKEHAEEIAKEKNDEKLLGFFLKKHSTGGESVFSITKEEEQGYSIAPDNNGLLIGISPGESPKDAVQVPDLKFNTFLKVIRGKNAIKEELNNNKFEELNNLNNKEIIKENEMKI